MATLSNQMNAAIKDIQDVYGSVNKALPGVVRIINNAISKNFDRKGRWDGDKSNITLFSGGSVGWVPLSKRTEKNYKRKGYELAPTLYRQGNLRRSIEVRQTGETGIIISCNSPYGAIHNFGGVIDIKPRESTLKFKATKSKKTVKNDKGKEKWNEKYQYRFAKGRAKGKNIIEKKVSVKAYRVVIPARPFLTLAPEDMVEIKDYLRDFWRK